MVQDYEKLLEKAKKEFPELEEERERLKIPKVTGHIEGNKTIISNYHIICKTIAREPEHMLKYILKQLATAGKIYPKGVVFSTKLSSSKINKAIMSYIDEFVICPKCKRPDTELKIEGAYGQLICKACGSKYPIKTKI